MFEKIQHPITGKWHKISSAIGSQLIKNYSKKLKLNGGAMDLRPGQDIWYYITEINNELNSLREQIHPHVPTNHASLHQVARAPPVHEISRDLRLVNNELRRITAQDGIFSVEMNNQSAGLTEALRNINDNIRDIAHQIDVAYQYYNPPDAVM